MQYLLALGTCVCTAQYALPSKKVDIFDIFFNKQDYCALMQKGRKKFNSSSACNQHPQWDIGQTKPKKVILESQAYLGILSYLALHASTRFCTLPRASACFCTLLHSLTYFHTCLLARFCAYKLRNANRCQMRASIKKYKETRFCIICIPVMDVAAWSLKGDGQ